MGNEDSEQTSLKKFRFAGSTISHFFARKSLKNTLILGIVLLVYTYSKADGFVKAYPTAISRARLASTLGSNVGVEALLGVAHDISSVGGYVVWNFLCIITAAGAIWGLLFAISSWTN
jgi:putative exporter of polyketide antibiotics